MCGRRVLHLQKCILLHLTNVSAATWGCLACRHNMDSVPGSESCFCNAGYFGPECRPCEAGKYKDETGQGECEACPPHSSAGPGSAVCQCNAGFESGGGTCIACPAGKYKSITANEKCQNCLPQMSTSTRGTLLESDCQCMPGWFEIQHAPNSSKMEMCSL